jgi:hypothetical protein
MPIRRGPPPDPAELLPGTPADVYAALREHYVGGRAFHNARQDLLNGIEMLCHEIPDKDLAREYRRDLLAIHLPRPPGGASDRTRRRSP